MTNERTPGVRTAVCLVVVMLLAACGQTGVLVLPGAQPNAPPTTDAREDTEQKEDEERQ